MLVYATTREDQQQCDSVRQGRELLDDCLNGQRRVALRSIVGEHLRRDALRRRTVDQRGDLPAHLRLGRDDAIVRGIPFHGCGMGEAKRRQETHHEERSGERSLPRRRCCMSRGGMPVQ